MIQLSQVKMFILKLNFLIMMRGKWFWVGTKLVRLRTEEARLCREKLLARGFSPLLHNKNRSIRPKYQLILTTWAFITRYVTQKEPNSKMNFPILPKRFRIQPNHKSVVSAWIFNIRFFFGINLTTLHIRNFSWLNKLNKISSDNWYLLQ